MDWVHEGVHKRGSQAWSMDLGSMFCIRRLARVEQGHLVVRILFFLSSHCFSEKISH